MSNTHSQYSKHSDKLYHHLIQTEKEYLDYLNQDIKVIIKPEKLILRGKDCDTSLKYLINVKYINS